MHNEHSLVYGIDTYYVSHLPPENARKIMAIIRYRHSDADYLTFEIKIQAQHVSFSFFM